MFKNFTSFIIALTVASVATAAPGIKATNIALTAASVETAASGTNSLFRKATDLSPNVQVCTGAAATGTGCVTIPISDETCVNFLQGLSFLNKEVSWAVIPNGLVCTFYEQFSCESSQGGADAVVLQGGTWDFFEVPGTAGTVNFNDLSSSFICSEL